MSSNEAKNEMLVTVLIDPAGICRKLAQSTVLADDVRGKAQQFVEEFDSLLPVRGRGTATEHFQGEGLIIKIARFLPTVLEVNAKPRPIAVNE